MKEKLRIRLPWENREYKFFKCSNAFETKFTFIEAARIQLLELSNILYYWIWENWLSRSVVIQEKRWAGILISLYFSFISRWSIYNCVIIYWGTIHAETFKKSWQFLLWRFRRCWNEWGRIGGLCRKACDENGNEFFYHQWYQ